MFGIFEKDKTPLASVENETAGNPDNGNGSLSGVIDTAISELPPGPGGGGPGHDDSNGNQNPGNMASVAESNPSSGYQRGVENDLAASAENVKEIIALAFGALDETLRDTLRDSWEDRTGDKGLAMEMAERARCKPAVKNSVIHFGAAVAAKYKAGGQWTPEIGLCVALGGYAAGMAMAFKALKLAPAPRK